MDAKYIEGSPLPNSIGACADLFHDVQELRRAMAKEVEAVERREREIKNHIIDNLSKSDDTGAAGLRYRAQIVTKTVPAAEDWDKIRAYVAQTGRFDLLQNRLSDKAVTDMWEEGEEVPGIGRFNSVSVSIKKL